MTSSLKITTAALLDQTIYLEPDIEMTDRYDRFLFYIWLEDGTLYNLTLLEQGLATVTTYLPNVKYVDYFTADQEKAREKAAACCSPARLII